MLVLWGLIFSAVTPVRQAYVNGLIESKHRATVLSFHSLLGSGGAAVTQPVLGKGADVWGYPASYVWTPAIQALAVPCLWLARREHATSEPLGGAEQDAR
jgi:MFS family permease